MSRPDPALDLLAQLQRERQMLNEAIYHVRRRVLGLSYKRAKRLSKRAMQLKAKEAL